MKFKMIAALLLGLMMAIPGAVIAQNSAQGQYDQAPDQNSKPSPNIPMQSGPSDQGVTDQDAPDQDSMNQDSNQGLMNQAPSGGPNDPGPADPSSTAPAPEEKNGVARISLIH